MILENHTGLLTIDRRLRKGFTWLNPNGVSLKSVGFFAVGTVLALVPTAPIWLVLFSTGNSILGLVTLLVSAAVGGFGVVFAATRTGKERRTPSRRIYSALQHRFTSKEYVSMTGFSVEKHAVRADVCTR